MSKLAKKKTGKKDHVNVMLLAMSTLPGNPKMNTYQYADGEKMVYFKSYSQMEPHTKLTIHLLAKKGEKLDRIVILESKEARTQKKENWKGETATDLFKKRIINYLGGSENIEISLEDMLPELQETGCNSKIYEGKYPEICLIDLEDPVYFWNAVQEIRKGGRKVHLYMDMQGGDRNAVSQMNAIAELLVRQKVDIKKRFANDYEFSKTLHTIRDAGKEYRTYELISAMDIFTSYGWGDKLQQYFKGVKDEDSWESMLLTAIEEASKAISQCSPDRFDRAVRKIEDIQKTKESDESEPGKNTISELDVVYQDIKENYASLLNQKYRYVAQIRWCLDKKFLQQAMTILEAKMPYEFIHSGLIYYLTKNDDKEKFLKSCKEMYCENINREKGKIPAFKMKDLNHYLLKDYAKGYVKNEDKNYLRDYKKLFKYGIGIKNKSKVEELLIKYWNLSDLRNHMNHATADEHDPNGFFCYMQKECPEDSNWKNDVPVDYEQQIRNFLDEWERLADQVPDFIREQVEDAS